MILIWKLWDPDQPDEPNKRMDRRRVTGWKQEKFEDLKITNKIKVTGKWRSTSKVPRYTKQMYREQESINEFVPKDFAAKVIDDYLEMHSMTKSRIIIVRP